MIDQVFHKSILKFPNCEVAMKSVTNTFCGQQVLVSPGNTNASFCVHILSSFTLKYSIYIRIADDDPEDNELSSRFLVR